MLDFQDQQHEERYKDKWYGKYRAFVRDNNDPERLGRCRLEIPAVLGVGVENWSDWAWPCFPYGGNDDIGMFLVPEEGASVWAEFEGGEVQYPIWTGVWLAMSNPGEQPEESKRLCSSATCRDCEDRAEHQPDAADNLEHRKYHAHPPYYCPRRKVLVKTETGHTIVMDDRDEQEFLKIIDRAGQVLHMYCPVKAEVQSENTRRRGTHDFEASPANSEESAGQGSKQIDIARDIKGGKAFVQVTDACRQFVRLEAWQDKEKIHISSSDKTRSRWQKILIDTTKGRESICIWGLGGTQEIQICSTAGKEEVRLVDKAGQVFVLSSVSGRERIQLTDKAGSKLTMDGAMGHVIVRSTGKVLINP